MHPLGQSAPSGGSSGWPGPFLSILPQPDGKAEQGLPLLRSQVPSGGPAPRLVCSSYPWPLASQGTPAPRAQEAAWRAEAAGGRAVLCHAAVARLSLCLCGPGGLPDAVSHRRTHSLVSHIQRGLRQKVVSVTSSQLGLQILHVSSWPLARTGFPQPH